MQSRIVLVAVVVAVVVGAVTHAAAAPDTAVLVDGDAPADTRKVVSQAVAATARERSWEVVDAPFTEDQQRSVISCFTSTQPWPCVGPIATARGITRVIVVKLDRAPSGFTLTEQILIAGADRAALIDQHHCAPCKSGELADAVTDLTRRMIRKSEARREGTAIRVTVPAGATVTLDGQRVDATKPIPTTPGAHAFVVELAGHHPTTERVTIESGQVLELTPVLVPLDVPRPGGTRYEWYQSRLAAGICFGFSAVLIGYGAAALYRDAQDDDDYNYPQAQGFGIAALVGGGLTAIVGGVVLWDRTRERKRQSVPMVSVTPQGATLGWSVRF